MICQHPQQNKIKDFGEQKLYFCPDCNIITAKFKRAHHDDEKQYEEYYDEKSGGRFGFGLESIIRIFRFNRARNIKKINPSAKSILDIGCGRGFILYYLKRYFALDLVVGTQISAPAVEFAKNKLGLDIYKQDLLQIDFKEQKFDTVVMLHVLEHVPEPEQYIKKIYELLNNDGVFLVEVPNFDAWTRKVTGKYWLSLDPEYHLSFFNIQNLTKLLKKYNFKVEKINTFSFEYSIFTSAQSIVSKMTNSQQLVYKFIQDKKFTLKLVPHIIIFAVIGFLSLIINILLYNSKKGEVIRIIARK